MAQSISTLKAPDPIAETLPGAPAGGRRLRYALAGMAFLSVALWFAPAIVGRTGVRHQFVHFVLPDYPGAATVGSVSLSWLSPVVARDVSLTDIDGNTLMTVEELTTSHTLASLLFGSGSDYGTITLKKPHVDVRVRHDGSNLEEAIAPLLEGESSVTGMTVVVEGGELRWTEVDGQGTAGTLTGVSATVRQVPESSWPETVDVTAVLSDGERQGDLSVKLAPANRDGGNSHREAVVKADRVPLAPLEPWLTRYGVDFQSDGILSVDALVTETAGEQSDWSFDGTIQGRQLRVLHRLGLDHPLLMESLVLKARGKVDEQSLSLEASDLRCDVGTATMTGQIALDAGLAATGWEERARWAIDQNVTLNASIDLAKLIAQLPDARDVRQAIDSGRVELNVQTVANGQDRLAECRVNASDIVAGPAARGFVWRDPFSFVFRVRKSASGLTIDEFVTRSDFVTITGSGTRTEAELRIDANLDRLRQQLAQIVPLPAETIAGRLTGTVRIQQSAPSSAYDITAGEFSLVVNDDELKVILQKPVPLDSAGNWPLSITFRGQLERWLPRFRLVGIVPAAAVFDARGTVSATASVQYGTESIAVENLVAEAQQVQVNAGGRSIDEDRVRLTGSGRWNEKAIAVAKATLTSSSAAINAANVQFPLNGDGPISGKLNFRAGIGRIVSYVVSGTPAFWLSGVASGSLDIRQQNAATHFDANVDFERPQLSRPLIGPAGQTNWQTIWSDEKANVSLAGQYDAASDLLNVASFAVTGTGIALAGAGNVSRPTTIADTDLSGTIKCDLELLSRRISGELPTGIAVVGSGSKPFHVRGPLWSSSGVDSRLTASAGLGWDRADLWGLAIGAGELNATLRDQQIVTEPFDWPVGEGHVRGTAVVSLKEQSALSIGRGRLVENVVLTPELCRQWLRYAAPILADATQIEGSASIDVQGCRVPLPSPESTEAAGTLVLHRANASPGPVATSLLDLVRQIQTLAGKSPTNGTDLKLVAPAQNVAVRVSGGRIAHDRFLVHLGSETGPAITTTGSVGFDQSIDLVAEVPLDRAWFKNERVAATLGGQTLRIPIRGSLSRPTPDPRALQEFGRKAAAGAIGGFLDRELQNKLDEPLKKLFD